MKEIDKKVDKFWSHKTSFGRYMNYLVYASILSVFFLLSCSAVRYYTYYEGGFDPFLDFKNIKTIGFTPIYWTSPAKKIGYDELFEKQLFIYAKIELEKRGFKVFYIDPEFLEYDPVKEGVYIKPDFKEMPDLTLTVIYYQGLGNVVKAPGKTSGILSWGKSLGKGFYEQTQDYEVQTYFQVLIYTLWSGSPEYTNKAWEGVIKKGSPILNLHEQAQDMTYDVFLEKFGWKRWGVWKPKRIRKRIR